MCLKVVCEAVPKVLLVQCLRQFTEISNLLYDLVCVVSLCGFVWVTVIELFNSYLWSVSPFLYVLWRLLQILNIP